MQRKRYAPQHISIGRDNIGRDWYSKILRINRYRKR